MIRVPEALTSLVLCFLTAALRTWELLEIL